MSILVIASTKRTRKGIFFITSFVHSIPHHEYFLRTQAIKPMLPKHVFDFEKIKQIFEGLVFYQCTTFPKQIKQNNMDIFLFLFPNLPQIQSMNHIVMKTDSIQNFIFLVYRIIKIHSHQKLNGQ
jgi:hypothetical protein